MYSYVETSHLQRHSRKNFWTHIMGTITSMAQKISLGCRPRTHSFEELKDCYDDNRRSVIPMARAVTPEKYILAVNECGEEVVIADLSDEKVK